MTEGKFDKDSGEAEYNTYSSRIDSVGDKYAEKYENNKSYKMRFKEENGEIYMEVEMVDEEKGYYRIDSEGNWEPNWDSKTTYTFSGKRVKVFD